MHAPILIPLFPHFLSRFFKEPKPTFSSLRNSTLAVLQFQDSYFYGLLVNFAVRSRYSHDTLLNQTQNFSFPRLPFSHFVDTACSSFDLSLLMSLMTRWFGASDKLIGYLNLLEPAEIRILYTSAYS